MGIEIERKFLVADNSWRKENVPGVLYRQGYLSTDKEHTVRVRIVENLGFLTIRGRSHGPRRLEFEYQISVNDANEMINLLCQQPVIEKYRYKIEREDAVWEIDEFIGENSGLVLAEVELDHINHDIALPAWAGPEVTGNPQYYNSYLINNPYKNWKK